MAQQPQNYIRLLRPSLRPIEPPAHAPSTAPQPTSVSTGTSPSEGPPPSQGPADTGASVGWGAFSERLLGRLDAVEASAHEAPVMPSVSALPFRRT